MTESPLVSVIIAVYKPEAYLKIALESLLAQTRRDFEAIISDDGESEFARNLVGSLNDKRFRFRRNAKNLGACGNHVAALREAKGKYAAILNQDDIFLPDFLAKTVAPMEANANVVLVFCDHWIIDKNGSKLIQATDENSLRWKRQSLAEGCHQPFHQLVAQQSIPMAMGSTFRVSALDLELLPLEGASAYDLWFSYLLSLTGKAAYYIPERLSAWRVHAESTTSKGAIMWSMGAALCWEKIVNEASLREVRPLALKNARLGFSSLALRYLRENRIAEGRSAGLKSLGSGFSRYGLAVFLISFMPNFLRRILLRQKS